MTKQEAAIISAYTGIAMLTGKDFKIFTDYVEKILGRAIWTHEYPQCADEIKLKSKDDFLRLCENLDDYTDPDYWKERSKMIVTGAKVLAMKEAVDMLEKYFNENIEESIEKAVKSDVIKTINKHLEERLTVRRRAYRESIGAYEFDVYADLDPVTMESYWIPCEERYPEEEGWYLVTWVDFDGESAVAKVRFFEGEFLTCFTVTAWMPLPREYKPAEQKGVQDNACE